LGRLDLVGRRVELRVNDTPGSPALDSRVHGRVDLVRAPIAYESRDGEPSSRSWGLLIHLDSSWESTGSDYALVVPLDPRLKAPRHRLSQDVEVIAAPGVEHAEIARWGEVSAWADMWLRM
jgi:hypothetical protein